MRMRKVDWKNRDDVISFCKDMNAKHGKSSLVVHDKSHGGYNICLIARPDTWNVPHRDVVYRP